MPPRLRLGGAARIATTGPDIAADMVYAYGLDLFSRLDHLLDNFRQRLQSCQVTAKFRHF